MQARSNLAFFAQSLGYTTGKTERRRFWQGIIAVLIAIGVYAFANANETRMGLFWVLGLAFGVVLQRSRLCFASAFRDVFLLGQGRNLKGIIVGLAVATAGFAALMARQVPNTALGTFPPDAHVLPIGLHTLVGALLFGFGMVIAGGCVSGSVYRMGEGYVASWVSFLFIILGLLAASFTWNAWYEFTIRDSPRIWLPHLFGHGGAVFITFLALIAAYIAVLWWEYRNGSIAPDMPFKEDPETSFAATLNNLRRRVFVHGWPILLGGAILGGLNVITFISERPWGFTGELSRWGITISNSLNLGPGNLLGVNLIPGCVLDPGDGGVLHYMLFLVLGMIYGSFLAAFFAGEFKIRVPKQRIRFVQAAGGGLIM
ncbi:MAG: YeeE/YedE family protein, partial [Anaerolineae bacterium]|nr:YeeE/YedE family protein [Anaerolineae bacterium]